jgi:hypothetical protein
MRPLAERPLAAGEKIMTILLILSKNKSDQLESIPNFSIYLKFFTSRADAFTQTVLAKCGPCGAAVK